LEDPDVTPPTDMWKLTCDPLRAPDRPDDFVIDFEKGIPVKLEYEDQGRKETVTDSVDLFLAANVIASRNGVGRIDIVSSPMKEDGEMSNLVATSSRTDLSESKAVGAC